MSEECIKHTVERAKECKIRERERNNVSGLREKLQQRHNPFENSMPKAAHMLKKTPENKDRNCYITISVLNTHSKREKNQQRVFGFGP